MATRLYLHNDLSTVSGTLPTASQTGAGASVFDLDNQANNRSMDDTIGTLQASVAHTDGSARLDTRVYMARFVSLPLAQASIAANTWTWNYACSFTGIQFTWPDPDTNAVCFYVWRPSNGTKVGDILDGNTGATYTTVTPASTEKSQEGTFTGAAVAGAAVGDVLIFEGWAIVLKQSNSNTMTYFYDGTTVTTGTDNQTVSSHASFIETPENLTFLTAPPFPSYHSFSANGFWPAVAARTF